MEKKGRPEWITTALETGVDLLIILKWFLRVGFADADSSSAGEVIMMRCFKEDFEPYVPINIREFLQQLMCSVFSRRTPPLVVNHLVN
jgi:hypothetical protein